MSFVFANLCMFNVNVSHVIIWLEKGFSFSVPLAAFYPVYNLQTNLRLSFLCSQTVSPPAESAPVLEIAFTEGLPKCGGNTLNMSFVFLFPPQTLLMYALFLFDVLKCFEYLVHYSCDSITRTFQECRQWEDDPKHISLTPTFFFFFLKTKMTEDNLWIRFIYSFSRLDHPKSLNQSSSYPNFKDKN